MKKKKKRMNVFFFHILFQKTAFPSPAKQTVFSKKIYDFGATITKSYWISPETDAKLLYVEE